MIFGAAALADEAADMQEAKQLADQTGKLILMEFQREDCDHCAAAKQAAQQDGLVKVALGAVIHLPIDVLSESGKAVAESYHIGYSYPAYLLADKEAREITRWVGFTTSDDFVNSLSQATRDLTTVPEREARLKQQPNLGDAAYLGLYYYNTRQYLKSAEAYRQAQSMPQNRMDYSYRIFQSLLEACWNGDLPFDSVMAAVDTVMAHNGANSKNTARAVSFLTRLARRTGDTDRIARYLDSGMVATARMNDQEGKSLHISLLADYALHIKHDTATALELKQKDLGTGWETDPQRYFQFGQWCLERGINLEQAEKYVRQAANLASGGKFKAMNLRVLADIVHARGRTKEAMGILQEAMDLDPANAWYEKRFEEMQAGL